MRARRFASCAALATLAACAVAPPPAPPPRAPQLTLAIPCADTALDALALPEGDADHRGTIVGCTPGEWLSAEALAALARTAGARIVPRSGAHVLRIAYVTTRSDDAPALATARVLVPDAPRTTAMAVVAHPTVGIADRCAPSARPLAPDALAVPWAAAGWPTILPDYAGLGTAGVQGYGDGDDTARSTLDAARALRALLPASMLGDDIVLVGHSQGGGAVLSAQAIAREYGAGGRIALVLPIAPGWPVSTRLEALRDPTLRTRGGQELGAVVAALFLYSWHARRYGEEHAGNGFDPAHRDALVRALSRGCTGELLESVPRAAPTIGALIDDGLRRGLLDCIDGHECTGPASELSAWAERNVMHGDPDGAPIRMFVGAADELTTPARMRCIADHLERDGLAPDVCVLDADHLGIVPYAAALAIASAEAQLSGAPLPSCRRELPPCELP